ncbi:MAG: hypothetical protein WA323_10830 [Candidatus Nitrosopolaris sp.]
MFNGTFHKAFTVHGGLGTGMSGVLSNDLKKRGFVFVGSTIC